VTALDVAELTHLEFAATIPCEHRQHPVTHVADDPAAWVITIRCPKCDRGATYLICESGRLRMAPPHTIACVGFRWIGGWDDLIVSCLPIPEAMRGAA
jgi:hypothetical protein